LRRQFDGFRVFEICLCGFWRRQVKQWRRDAAGEDGDGLKTDPVLKSSPTTRILRAIQRPPGRRRKTETPATDVLAGVFVFEREAGRRAPTGMMAWVSLHSDEVKATSQPNFRTYWMKPLRSATLL
jgi:hypothetical protein